MKRSTKLALAASAVAYGAAVCLVTEKLADIAMARELPPKYRGQGARISGEGERAEYRQAQKKAAQALASSPHELVHIRSRDGLVLVGHWFERENARRVLVAFHGWRSAWYRDFGLISDFWRDEGCSVLYVEQRAQSESEGEYIGFGLRERYDCVDWLDWVTERCGTALPIYLAGVSMGASTVLMAAGLELPVSVHGILADSAYTSPHDIWKYVARHNLHIPFGLGSLAADRICRRRLAVGSNECSTVQALRGAKTPVLLIHGTDDHFVPPAMAQENCDACRAPHRLLMISGADHAMGYYTSRAEYEEAERLFWSFFDR